MLVDDSDGIWIGTNAGGVNYSGAFHQNFDKYHIVGDEPLANCLVRGFADDGEGRLWITTEKSGLMTYSLKTKEFPKPSSASATTTESCGWVRSRGSTGWT